MTTPNPIPNIQRPPAPSAQGFPHGDGAVSLEPSKIILKDLYGESLYIEGCAAASDRITVKMGERQVILDARAVVHAIMAIQPRALDIKIGK